jgi:hypothetical protein
MYAQCIVHDLDKAAFFMHKMKYTPFRGYSLCMNDVQKLMADFWGFRAFFWVAGYIPIGLASFGVWRCLKRRLNDGLDGVGGCKLIDWHGLLCQAGGHFCPSYMYRPMHNPLVHGLCMVVQALK